MEEIKIKKIKKRDFFYGVGRRKGAVARVRLYGSIKEGQKWKEEELKKGQILVNGLVVEKYFSGSLSKTIYTEPLRLVQALAKYAITAKITGGGPKGQLVAFVHGLSRCLAGIEKQNFRPILKKAGLLTRDSRVRERRKVGTGGKARRKKQSPKR